MKIQDVAEREYYELEASSCNWSLRELQRQYDSSLFERLALSGVQKKHWKLFDQVEAEPAAKTAYYQGCASGWQNHAHTEFCENLRECYHPEFRKAIQLLRYFYEEMLMLHVISAGSLLEFSMQKVNSFPVGRVEFLYLHPLNFQEYLAATGRQDLLKQLQEIPVKSFAHPVLMDTFHRYAIIGGMPEVVKTDIAQHSLSDLTAWNDPIHYLNN